MRERRRWPGTGKSRRMPIAVVMAAAMVAPLVMALPSAADDTPSRPLTEQGYSAEESKALTQAAESGQPVELLSHRGEASQVFANPVNLFVASFIGSPAMSLIPLEVATVDGRTVLTSAENWTIALSDENARKVQGATSRKVVLGARHSAIRLHKSQVEGAVPAKVYIVEPTGDVTFVVK